MKALAEILSGENGLSFTRVAGFLILLYVLGISTYLTVLKGELVPPDWQQVTLLLGALGAKVIQRPFEKPPMNKTKSLITLAAGILALASCTGCTGFASAIKAAGGDPAIVTGSINTIYGTGKFTRIGGDRRNQTVAIQPDGTVVITNVGAPTNAPTAKAANAP